MLGSAVLIVLPGELLGPMRSITQLLALPQLAAREAALAAKEKMGDIGSKSVTAGEYRQTLLEKQAVENRNVALHQQVAELQGIVEELSGTRRHGFPPHGVLIPARVISLDAAAGRDSLIIGKGRSRNIRMGDWVASRLFMETGEDDGVREQLPVLAGECLIGWVDQVSPWVSRVVLLTDPQANRAMRVRISSADGNQPPLAADGRPVDFALRGAGAGRMTVTDIPREFVDHGRIRVGDRVVSDPNNPSLPVALVVGEIRELNHNLKKPLYYEATVAPVHDLKSLSRVLVVDVTTASARAAQRE